jgi:hypothetical protein
MKADLNARKRCFFFLLLICFTLTLHATAFTNTRSGDWNDPTIWDLGTVPATLDKVTIAAGTTVTVTPNSRDYSDCDSLIINGFLNVGSTNLTIGGRDLQIDARAVRNTSCIINGSLRIAGDWSHTFKVYGNVKFNTGSSFDMTAGTMMIDGSSFVEERSVPADKAILDVTDATNFSATGGLIVIWSPHFHANGLTIKGTKHFYSVSFGNNLTLPAFACRNPNDFVISETHKPTFERVQLAYLFNPTRENRVILNDIRIQNLTVRGGILAGAGRMKVSEQVLIGPNGRIERDIELNGTGQQNISTFEGNTTTIIKGNIYVNNPSRIKNELNLEVQNGTIHFLQGKFDLTNKTVTLATAPQNASSTSYFISQNYESQRGTLVIKNLNGATQFPVGTENDFLPVTITANNSDFSVSAYPLSISYASPFFGINSEWSIQRTAGSGNADLKVQWNTANETQTFATHRNNCRLFRNTNGNWHSLSNNQGITQQNGLVFEKLELNVSGFSSFTVLTQANAIPVKLRNFNVKKTDWGAVLTWATASENDNAGFKVEKSFDGKTFIHIGELKGFGTTNVPQYYNFLDKTFTETAFYRLKQENFDGTFIYSTTVTANSEKNKTEVKIYPNPIRESAYLSVEIAGKQNEKWDLSIQNAYGQVVFQKNNLLTGDLQNIPTHHLANGFYMLILSNRAERVVSSFIK